jgi:hypothetical protein
MRELFDEPFPTWSEAIQANPGAMVDHFLWNARLIPHGLELMLFNQTSGSPRTNPDFVPVTSGTPAALVGLLAVAAFILVGLTLGWRERQRWWEEWLRDRAWGWVVLGCLAVSAVVVMVTIRPRPSYLFHFSVLLLALIGTSALVIGSRWPRLARLRAAIPLVAAVILIAVPSRYDEHYQTPQAGQGRPLLQMVDRLKPFEDVLSTPRARLLAPQFADETCAYINPTRPCRGTSLLQAVLLRGKGTSLPRVMKQIDTNLIYADELVVANPSVSDLLHRLERKDWEPLGPPPGSSEGWTLLRSPIFPQGPRS